MSKFIKYLLLVLMYVSCGQQAKDDRIPAFPGAEGFGAFTQGGRGGKVYIVTTLEDYDADEPVIEGSLRQAVEAEGPRTIVFEKGGLISLKRILLISNPFITIAGQTAPGDGICLKDFSLVIETDEVIIRHIRSRLGEDQRQELDAVSINFGNNIILDHCSASWSTDEVLSSYSEMVTIQWCIIAEGLFHSFHPKGPHSMGSIIEGKTGAISLLNNIYAHNNSRNPLIQNKGEEPGAVVEIRNNVIYDWGELPGYTSNPGQARINYVNNYIKPGPSTSDRSRQYAFEPENHYTNIYIAGNYHAANQGDTTDNTRLLMASDSLRKEVVLEVPYPTLPYQQMDAETLFETVLNHAGATLPKRDAVDQRIVNDVRTGTGKIINSQNDVGGWPTYAAGISPLDTDRDGMPDEWEDEHGLDIANGSDHAADNDGDGYTNLEEWLNGTNPNNADAHELTYGELTKVLAQKDAMYEQDVKIVKQRLQQEREERMNRKVPDYKAEVAGIPDGNMKLMVDGKPVLQLNHIEAGTFLMGSPVDEPGREEWELQHEVTISKPYYLATVEMSNSLLRLLTGMKNYGDNSLPATVSWFDAEWICEVLSSKTGHRFRLPTEAEWEYACRAGTTTPYFTGHDISLEYANFKTGDPEQTIQLRPVDDGKPNPWGLINMPGNQFEWCLDWKGNYETGAVTDPRGPSQENSLRSFDGLYRKIMRGGNYGSAKELMRSAYRYDYSRDVKYGFRVLMEEN
ncbi:SUMF1/EgtB/PvdO family nonheme iron enzyme [Parapedobacter sp. 2B3]|uniref:SUMF1/EgtB/PvdO family nonheme iron enzyme n=1 Tax=Parapedobacter sp. 2B3 TaxID=3342381 RepID=UPI0035B59286